MQDIRMTVEDARELEITLGTAFRILENGYQTGIWSRVCREALLDIVRVRRELDRRVCETVEENFS